MRFHASGAPLDCEIEQLIIAGWTGRDADAVQHHIDELARIGVSPPSQVPLFYRVSSTLLTQAPEIEVLGEATSGEVEPLIVNIDGAVWLGLGSDHTDRKLETVSVAVSKQVCLKPISAELWRLNEIAAHLDDLILRCWIEEAGEWTLYQQGTLANILPLQDLAERAGLAPRGAMLCGTLSAIGPVRTAGAHRMELVDEMLGRSLHLDYRVKFLPVVE